jgi:lipoate-protein ligase A
MTGWRILLDSGRAAAEQMSCDESLAKEARPTARLFLWDPPALSLGWKQPRPEWLSPSDRRRRGIAEARPAAPPPLAEPIAPEVIERPTGGGIAVHGSDVSMAVVVPRAWGLRLAPLMRLVCQSAVALCHSYGAEAHALVEAPRADARGPSRPGMSPERRHAFRSAQWRSGREIGSANFSVETYLHDATYEHETSRNAALRLREVHKPLSVKRAPFPPAFTGGAPWCAFVEAPAIVAAGGPSRRLTYCLAEASPYAVLLADRAVGAGGRTRKVAGFAARRFPESWLIQGSLLVRPLPEPLVRALPEEVQRQFAHRAIPLAQAAARPVTEQEVAARWAAHWTAWWAEALAMSPVSQPMAFATGR